MNYPLHPLIELHSAQLFYPDEYPVGKIDSATKLVIVVRARSTDNATRCARSIDWFERRRGPLGCTQLTMHIPGPACIGEFAEGKRSNASASKYQAMGRFGGLTLGQVFYACQPSELGGNYECKFEIGNHRPKI